MASRKLIGLALLLPVLLLGAEAKPSLLSSAGGEQLAWVRETFRTPFVTLAVSVPASLTPVEIDEGMTGGYSMKSFDGQTTFSYTDTATYFEVTEMSRQNYLAMTSCDPHESARSVADAMKSKAYEGKIKILSCSREINKRVSIVKGAYVEDVKGNQPFDSSILCGYVLGIAPVLTEESRFVVQIALCSRRLKQAEVAAIARGMFETLSFSYVGGCRREPSQIGCNWRRSRK